MALNKIMPYLLATQDFKIKGVYSPKKDILLPYSDSDWAGLYSAIGDVRSRTGAEIKYNGMPVGWMSKFQKCKGTSFDEEMELDESMKFIWITKVSSELNPKTAARAIRAFGLRCGIKFAKNKTDTAILLSCETAKGFLSNLSCP